MSRPQEPYWIEGFPHVVTPCGVCGCAHALVVQVVPFPLSGIDSCAKSLAHDVEAEPNPAWRKRNRRFVNSLRPVDAQDLADLPGDDWGEEWWEE